MQRVAGELSAFAGDCIAKRSGGEDICKESPAKKAGGVTRRHAIDSYSFGEVGV